MTYKLWAHCNGVCCTAPVVNDCPHVWEVEVRYVEIRNIGLGLLQSTAPAKGVPSTVIDRRGLICIMRTIPLGKGDPSAQRVAEAVGLSLTRDHALSELSAQTGECASILEEQHDAVLARVLQHVAEQAALAKRLRGLHAVVAQQCPDEPEAEESAP